MKYSARFYQAIAILLIFSCVFAFADVTTLSLDETRQKLSGKTSKEWVLVRVEAFMGVQAECRQGETYTFHSDNTVTHRRCEDGHWKVTTETWSLNDMDELDRELVIGDQRYLLLLRDTADEEQLRLRTRSSDKTTPSLDKLLKHELD